MRHAFFLAFLAALPASAMAQQREVPPEGQDIVVTGARIQDYRDRLAACLARNCPPNEDIDATTALAEMLFMAGEYRDARTTLRASLGRNRDEARNYPEPVSDLYRANARVARHLGLDGDAQRSTREILRALQAGLPVEDHRHFSARLEIAQSLVAFRQYPAARRELRRLAELARAAGRADVAAIAELRSLWVDYVEFPQGSTVRDLTALSRRTGPENRISAIGARMLLVRIYGERGDSRHVDALLAELRQTNTQRRQLLFAPLYQLTVNADESQTAGGLPDEGRSMDTTLARQAGNFDDMWIDVAFWVQPDGRVSDLQIVRKRGNPDWADPLLQSIRGRRYAAIPGNEATYRLERYTYTSGYETRTGSRIAQRSPLARVEYFDLTAGEPPRP
jgi:tetratricopeptide (TPR) repeat protein